MRTNLKVPFAEKDEAKKLGARWDAARKVWYVDSKVDISPFSRWSPVAQEGPGGDDLPRNGVSSPKQQTSGKLIVGSNYVEIVRVCDCLPWDVCDKCQSTAFPCQAEAASSL